MSDYFSTRDRVEAWIKVHANNSIGAGNDRLAVSYVGTPLLLSDIKTLLEKLAAPCGSCHPCTEYADETWRAAGRKPPHVYRWDGINAVVSEIAKLHVSDPREPGRCLSCSTRLPCPTVKALRGIND